MFGDFRNKCLKLMRGQNGTLVDDEPMSYDINYPCHNLYSVLSSPKGGVNAQGSSVLGCQLVIGAGGNAGTIRAYVYSNDFEKELKKFVLSKIL